MFSLKFVIFMINYLIKTKGYQIQCQCRYNVASRHFRRFASPGWNAKPRLGFSQNYATEQESDAIFGGCAKNVRTNFWVSEKPISKSFFLNNFVENFHLVGADKGAKAGANFGEYIIFHQNKANYIFQKQGADLDPLNILLPRISCSACLP